LNCSLSLITVITITGIATSWTIPFSQKSKQVNRSEILLSPCTQCFIKIYCLLNVWKFLLSILLICI